MSSMIGLDSNKEFVLCVWEEEKNGEGEGAESRNGRHNMEA
jgi:hypothetical protein